MVHAERVPHQVVGLADELHVSVLDAVVDHLDEVAGAVLANPVAARVRARLGRDRLGATRGQLVKIHHAKPDSTDKRKKIQVQGHKLCE